METSNSDLGEAFPIEKKEILKRTTATFLQANNLSKPTDSSVHLKPYFAIGSLKDNSYLCKFCWKIYKSSHNYSNLRKHNKECAFNYFNEAASDSTSVKQQSIAPFFKTKMITTETEETMVRWFCIRNLSFTLADDNLFRQMVKGLSNSEQAVSSRTFSRVVERLSEQMVLKTKQDLDAIVNVSISWDGWTDIGGRTFIGYVYHGITDDWELVTNFLDLELNSEGDQSANAYARSFRTTMDSFKEGHNFNIVAAVSDNCPTMIKSARMLDLPRIGCLCHILNLMAKELESNHCPLSRDVIEAAKRFSNIIKGAPNRKAAFAAVVQGFNKSVMEFDDLDLSYEEKDGVVKSRDSLIMPTAVLLPAPTRWTTSYYVLERIKLLKEPIMAYIADNLDLELEAMLTVDYWKTLDEVMAVLKLFIDQIVALQDRRAIASVILPVLSVILSGLTDIESRDTIIRSDVSHVLRKARERISTYYAENTLALQCNLLDPRFKLDDTFLRVLGITVTMDEKRRMLYDLTAEEEVKEASIQPRKKPRQEELKQDTFTALSNAMTSPNSESDEFSSYLAEERASVDFDRYWKTRTVSYPRIAKAAKRLLAIPATSSEVERVFSRGSLTLPANRMSMKHTTLRDRIRVAIYQNITDPAPAEENFNEL